MRIAVENLTMPAAPLGPENPLPRFRDASESKDVRQDGSFRPEDRILFGYDTGFKVLPDLLQDGYGRHRSPAELKVIVLENDHIKALFLPEYGGRLMSLWDKDSEREILFRNPVFQPANLAIRNAWFSGGVEWNIGVLGHSTHTCSPVFFGIVKDDDGGEFLRMWEYQRTRGVFWQVDFHLTDGSRELGVHVRFTNDTGREVPMYWWTNTAVPEDESCRVFSGSPDVLYVKPESVNSQGAFHGFGRGLMPRLDSLPDRDASYPMNFNYSSEYFFQTGESEAHPWEAAGWGDGHLFFERSTSRLRYRKMFCWGGQPGGRHWCDHLSVPGKGDYVELQAGLAPTQVHGLRMADGETWDFTQFFGSHRAEDSGAFGGEWSEARDRVLEMIEARLPGDEVDRRHSSYASLAGRNPRELLHQGTGWGCLERKLRETENRSIPAGLVFPEDSLTEEQEPWLSLLGSGRFPKESATESPSWMCDRRWRKLLRNAAETDVSDPRPLVHLGVMSMEANEPERAMEYWQESIARRPTALGWRNIAVLLSRWNEPKQADEALRRAMDIADAQLLPYLSEELMELLAADGRYREAWTHFESLPDDIRNREGHVAAAAEAALALGHDDFLEQAFKRDYALIREGDRRLVDLWRKLRRRSGKNEEERPPANLDFRMVES